MNNPSAVEVEHNKGVEEPKRRGGDHKHIDRRDVGQVVMQEGPPGRGGNLGTPRYPAPNRGLADLDAELEQFPMDAGRAPPTGWPCSCGRSAKSGRATSTAAGLKGEADRDAVAAGRLPGVGGRLAGFPARRGHESGRRRSKQRRRESPTWE